MIKSLSFSQTEILKSIQELYCPDGFEVDITYGNGGFWKDLERPFKCYDLEPLQNFVIKADSENLPIDNSTITSIVYDPPFLTYIKNGRDHNSIMGIRFSGYWSYKDLEENYKNTLKEVSRILKKNGILVFKCQDIVHNHKFHCTHCNIVEWAKEVGLTLKDLFVLGAKHRMSIGKNKKQKHARIYQSYFLVLEKKK